MRTTVTLLISMVVSCTSAQAPGDSLHMFFDDASDSLVLDSVYPAGCWQVGTPSKSVFTSAYSPGKALVTDTLLPHPANSTCYAEFKLISTDMNYLGRTILYKQWLDMDTTSRASVEVYDPWLMTWYRFGTSDSYLMQDTSSEWSANGPYWTGASGGWEDVWWESPCIGVFWNEGEKGLKWYEPEMRLRFVFEGAPNPNARDGWMIDNVRAGVSLCTGSVTEQAATAPQLYPVPAGSSLEVVVPSGTMHRLQVLSPRGEIVQEQALPATDRATIDTSRLSDGTYSLRVFNGTSVRMGRFTVLH